MRYILFILLLLLNTSCYRWAIKHKERLCSELCTSQPIDTVITDTVTLTIPPDTSVFTALFKCDSAYNVIIDSVNIVNGKYLRLLNTYNNGKLTVTAIKPIIKHDTIMYNVIKYKQVPKYIETNKINYNLIALILLIIVIIIALKQVS